MSLHNCILGAQVTCASIAIPPLLPGRSILWESGGWTGRAISSLPNSMWWWSPPGTLCPYRVNWEVYILVLLPRCRGLNLFLLLEDLEHKNQVLNYVFKEQRGSFHPSLCLISSWCVPKCSWIFWVSSWLHVEKTWKSFVDLSCIYRKETYPLDIWHLCRISL